MNLVQVNIPYNPSEDSSAVPRELQERTRSEFDLEGPLYVPFMRTEAVDSDHILLDTENANWINVNAEGRDLLERIRSSQGSRIDELDIPERVTATNFIKQCVKREFVSNQPFERARYTGRHEFLGLDRLHEFWVVPNYDCNLRCRHCYTIEQVMYNPNVLNLDACRDLVDEAIELGTEIFYLTGGEVMQHPQILEMVDTIASRRKLILFTNGMLIDEEKADYLSRYRERLIVQISIEGHDEENNALIRGKRAFGPALQGLKNLLNAGVRVGVSSTPCKATIDSISQLTDLLCQLEVNGSRPEYHHLIMLLDIGGTKKNPDRTLLTHDEYSEVMDRCKAAAKEGNKKYGSRLKIANEKMMHACASNGPKKDLCGAGYTILGVDPEGNLKSCAATINDARFNMGKMLDENRQYIKGSLADLWKNGKKSKWIRQFSIARREGEREDDLRYFHGGACWYNMADPEKPLSTEHPFYESLEDQTLKAIKAEASRKARTPRKPGPAILSYMHRSRIACAGGRKTIDYSPEGLDNGYCICFA